MYMDGTEKFILGSIAVMFILYASALPFAQHYNSIEGLEEGTSETMWEKAYMAELQLTTSFGSAVILILFLIVYRVNKWKPGLKDMF